MVRPLIQHGVGQLEELFAKAKADQGVLKQLEHELQYRQVPRAVALLAQVKAAMDGSDPATASRQTVARPPRPRPQDGPSTPTSRPSAPALTPTATPVAARSAVEPVPAMPLDDAHKLLRATPSTTWESIEQTRRLLVQASHPEKLNKLPESKRAQALTEASLVNAAYAALSQARCTGR